MKAEEQPSLPHFQVMVFKNSQNQIFSDQQKINQYLTFFGIKSLQEIETIKAQTLKYLPPEIQYCQKEDFLPHATVEAKRYSYGKQFIEIDVSFGNFKFKDIVICNIHQSSPAHASYTLDSGNFCTVYKCKCRNQEIALKCFLKKDLIKISETKNILQTVIEEYCLLKLASALKAGPYLPPAFGYDIAVYQDCVEICMQRCLSIDDCSTKSMNFISQQLKQNLLQLHSLQLIHYDVKRDNICFSKHFNRFVFIDFGLGRLVKNKPGFKTLTGSRGTNFYCSEQMKQLFMEQISKLAFIDSYYNDIVGLIKTVDQMKKMLFNEVRVPFTPYLMDITRFHQSNFFKIQLYHQNYSFLILNRKMLSHKMIQEFDKISSLFYGFSKRKYFTFRSNLGIKFNRYEENQNVNLIDESGRQLEQSTIKELDQMNYYYPVSYFLDSVTSKNNQLIALMKNVSICTKLKKIDLLILLAKTIRINSNDLSIIELNKICEGIWLNCLQLKEDRIYFEDMAKSLDYYRRTSLFLFKQSFKQKLEGQYFRIFGFMIINVFVYQLLNPDQISLYYSQALHLPFSFHQKVEIILYFNQALTWLYMTNDQIKFFDELTSALKIKYQIFLKNTIQKYNQNEYQILQTFTDKIVLTDLNNSKEYLKQLPRKIFYKLKLWDNISFMKPYYYNLIDQIKFFIEQIYKGKYYFEYFHFTYLIYPECFSNTYYSDLLKKYQKCLKDLPKPYSLKVYQKLGLYQFKDIKRQELILFLSCQNRLATRLIRHRLLNFLAKFYYKINQNDKNQLIKIQLLTNLRIKIINHTNISIYLFPYIIEDIYDLAIPEIKYLQKSTAYNKLKDIIYKNYINIKYAIMNSQQLEASQNEKLFIIIPFIFQILIFQQKYYQALTLGKLLYRLYKQYKFIHSKDKFRQKIIHKIMYCIANYMFNKSNNNNIIFENKQYYFQYQRIIYQTKKESFYLSYQDNILKDLVYLAFHQRPQMLISLFNRISIAVQMNIQLIQLYVIKIQDIFRKKLKNIFFQKQQQMLYSKLQIVQNSYNIVVLFQLFLRIQPSKLKYIHFFKIFTGIKNIHILAKIFIFPIMIEKFCSLYQNHLKKRNIRFIRKKRYLCKGSINKQDYNFKISQKRNQNINVKILKKHLKKLFKSISAKIITQRYTLKCLRVCETDEKFKLQSNIK